MEGFLILAAAVIIVHAVVGRLFASAKLFELNLAIGISILATTLNAALSRFLARAASTSGSAALE